MNKSIRDKEIELYNKWGYLKELQKEDKLKKEKSYELMMEEDELYKKWLFYRNFLKQQDKGKGRKK